MYLSKNIDKNVRDSYQGLTYPLSLIHLKDVNGLDIILREIVRVQLK